MMRCEGSESYKHGVENKTDQLLHPNGNWIHQNNENHQNTTTNEDLRNQHKWNEESINENNHLDFQNHHHSQASTDQSHFNIQPSTELLPRTDILHASSTHDNTTSSNTHRSSYNQESYCPQNHTILNRINPQTSSYSSTATSSYESLVGYQQYLNPQQPYRNSPSHQRSLASSSSMSPSLTTTSQHLNLSSADYSQLPSSSFPQQQQQQLSHLPYHPHSYPTQSVLVPNTTGNMPHGTSSSSSAGYGTTMLVPSAPNYFDIAAMMQAANIQQQQRACQSSGPTNSLGQTPALPSSSLSSVLLHHPLPSSYSDRTTCLQPTAPEQQQQVNVGFNNSNNRSLLSSSTFSTGGNATSTGSPPMKRPRGRPRKHPLPMSHSIPQQSFMDVYRQQCHVALPSLDSSCLSSALPHVERHWPFTSHRSHRNRLESPTLPQTTDGNKKTLKKTINKKIGKKSLLLTPGDSCHDNVTKYLEQRQRLYSNEVFQHLTQLDDLSPEIEFAELYYGFGGPFTFLSLGQRMQKVIEGNEEKEIQKNSSDSLSSKFVTSTPQEVILSNCDRRILDGILLNDSFLWSSFNFRIPVRDLTVSRHHMVALLNDSSVYLYRHKVHPLVRTNVSRWEKIEALDDLNIVAVRLASGHLDVDWRIRYHEYRRPFLIKKIREELKKKNICLPPSPPPSNDSSNDLITDEELEVFVAEHPDGILCCSSEDLDPDWLPDPVVLAAIDATGCVHIGKCGGYFNYPQLIEIDKLALDEEQDKKMEDVELKDGCDVMKIGRKENQDTLLGEKGTELEEETTKNEDGNDLVYNGKPIRLNSKMVSDGVYHSEDLPTRTTAATSMASNRLSNEGQSRRYKLTRYSTSLDIIERHPDLTIPIKSNAGEPPMKVKAHIQDVALAELTEDSIRPHFNSSPSSSSSSLVDVAMVLYALGGKEHSAFVKGKNLYIRFKNFPTGPAKLHCGPLGHTGVILLANGSVWSWTAQASGPGSGNGKFGVAIHQVGGSLKGRVVVDLVGIGPEFLALTSDGVIHEWNSYLPYLNRLSGMDPELIVPTCMERPKIPEPIEWTPTFQKRLMNCTAATSRTYHVGNFSWFAAGEPPTQTPLLAPASAIISGSSDSVSSLGMSRPSLMGQSDSSHTPDQSSSPVFLNYPTDRMTKQPAFTLDHQYRQQSSDLSTMSSSASEWDQSRNVTAPDHPLGLDKTTTDSENQRMQQQQQYETQEQRCIDEQNSIIRLDPLDREVKIGNENMEDFRNLSEEMLEMFRQHEIDYRYRNFIDSQTHDRIERIFVMEGVTLAIRQCSGTFEVIPNDLNNRGLHYRCADNNIQIRDELNRQDFVNFNPGFTVRDGNRIVKQFGNLGKPLAANPVVIARKSVGASENEGNIRQQLESMATLSTTYRILTAPNSVIIAILKKIDLVESGKTVALARPPMLLAVDDPELILEALTTFKAPKEIAETILVEKKELNADDDDRGSEHGEKRVTSRRERRNRRRSNRRVGRPRGLAREKPKPKQHQIEQELKPKKEEIELDHINETMKKETKGKTIERTELNNKTPPMVGAAAGIRKRTRRQTRQFDEREYFVPESDKAWDQMIHMIEDEDNEEEEESPRIRRKKQSNTKNIKKISKDIEGGTVSLTDSRNPTDETVKERIPMNIAQHPLVGEGSKLQIKEPTEGGLSLSRLPMLNLDNDDIEDIYQAYPGLPPPLDISNGSRRQEDKQQIFNFSEAQRLELTSRQNEMTNGHLMMWNDRKGGSPSTTRPWPINR